MLVALRGSRRNRKENKFKRDFQGTLNTIDNNVDWQARRQ